MGNRRRVAEPEADNQAPVEEPGMASNDGQLLWEWELAEE
jgi:hypothetical protein